MSWQWWVLLWIVLQLVSRWSETGPGVKFSARGGPIAGDWEWFDWLPRRTRNTWDNGSEQLDTVTWYDGNAVFMQWLFLRISVSWSRTLWQLTKAEAEALQKLAEQGKEIFADDGTSSVPDPEARAKHAALQAKWCRPGRRVKS